MHPNRFLHREKCCYYTTILTLTNPKFFWLPDPAYVGFRHGWKQATGSAERV